MENFDIIDFLLICFMLLAEIGVFLFLIVTIFRIFKFKGTDKNVFFRLLVDNNILYLTFLFILIFICYRLGFCYGNIFFFCTPNILLFKMLFIFLTILYLFSIRSLNNNDSPIIVPEYCILILFFLLLNLLLVCSTNILIIFLFLEAQHLVSLILVSLDKKSYLSLEAVLKYFFFASFAGGCSLLGCSLIFFVFGTLDISKVVRFSNENLIFNLQDSFLLQSAIFLILISFLFKFAIFPFQNWWGDIFSAFPSFFLAFFAVIPKITAFIALAKLFFLFNFLPSYYIQFLVSFFLFTFSVGFFFSIYEITIWRFLAYTSIPHMSVLLLIFILTKDITFFICLTYIFVSVFSFFGILLILFSFSYTQRENLDILDIKSFELVFLSELSVINKWNSNFSYYLCFFFLVWTGLPPVFAIFLKVFMLLSLSFTFNYFVFSVLLFFFIGTYLYYIRYIRFLIFNNDKDKLPIFNNRRSIPLSLNIIIILLFIILFFFNIYFLFSLVVFLF